MYLRYAIYFAPEAGSDLDSFGTSWLGWDLDRGQPAPHPDIQDFDIAAVTERPRKYGFHGTLKAPFRLAAQTIEEDLSEALERTANNMAPFEIPSLQVTPIGKFLAIVEDQACPQLRAMAAQLVQTLDRFRAPLTDAELKRRRQSKLTPTQDALLVKWGYPYVFEAFQFHLTLSGPLDPNTQERVSTEAKRRLHSILDKPQRCNDVSLCAEREDGTFIRLSRHPFRG
ncbi:MAG: DUF1045 domain-containing protein [Pseudomonadota bacterium]